MTHDAQEMLQGLEAQAKSLSIRVIYSRLLQRGGHCWLHGRPIVLLSSHLDVQEKVDLLKEALAQLQPRIAPQDERSGSVDSVPAEC